MGNVRIVTNAVCDLSVDEAQSMGVTIIPECIVFDNIPYLSNIDFDAPELYRKMRSSNKLPTGSQPNISMYMDAFEAQRGKCDEIICINMTSRMSGSFNTANIAKDMMEEDDFPAKIYIFDSLQLSHGLGFLVKYAAKLASDGENAENIIAGLSEIKGKIGEYFVMKSLVNAKKGGRIGAIKTVLADTLNVKPILMFRDGIVSDVSIVHTFKQAIASLVPYYEKQAEYGNEVIIFHADNIEDANYVKSLIQAVDPLANIKIEWLGSAIGIYTGEGAVGITFWEK